MVKSRFSFKDLQAEYAQLWSTMEIRPEKLAGIVAAAARLKAHEDLYREAMARTGVPWLVVGIIHSMERDCDPTAHLHNGDPLTARTVQKPAGRPPTGEPPFKWIDSAVDALTSHNLDTVGDWPPERVAYELEKYNGWGYREPDRGKSAYLWSGSNHYTKGKFTSDDHFNPDVESDQAGAMPLLKHLTESGEQTETVTVNDIAKTVPLTTGLWLPEARVVLLPNANAEDANDAIEVNERCRKIREVDDLWEVDVFRRDGSTAHGFAPGDVFKPEPAGDPVVDADLFAQLCINAARQFGTSGHHLIAVADTETAIKNVAAEKGDGAGPFLITAAAWVAVNLDVAARNDPYKQPFVAARIAADAAAALKPSIPDRLPTSAELYIGHLVGPDHVAKVLSNPDATLKAAITTEIGAEQYSVLSSVRPWLCNETITVKAALEKASLRLDLGYVRADGLYERIEPEVVVAAGFAARLRNGATAEWEFFGKQSFDVNGVKTKSGHTETEARQPPGAGEDWFARVGKYWREGVNNKVLDGRNTRVPWSAAFISFVVKDAGAGNHFRYSPQHSVYISKAIRDAKNKSAVAYWCLRLNECKPKVGDIVCWTRQHGIDYDNQHGGDYAGHCDIVVEAGVGQVKVIGGNIGQSVSERVLALNAEGNIKPITLHSETLFAIMQNQLL